MEFQGHYGEPKFGFKLPLEKFTDGDAFIIKISYNTSLKGDWKVLE